jgi:transposase
MMKRRRGYTLEFKESAVKLYQRSEKTAKEIAEGLGVHPENLRRWVKEREEGERNNVKVFPGRGNARDEELTCLRKEVADLRETNEILKKAMAFFAAKTS